MEISWHDEFMNKTSISKAIRIDHVDGRTVFVTVGEIWHNKQMGREIIIVDVDGNGLLDVVTVEKNIPVLVPKVSRCVNYFVFHPNWIKGRLPIVDAE